VKRDAERRREAARASVCVYACVCGSWEDSEGYNSAVGDGKVKGSG
jgi:hypothetical protein